MPEARTRDRTSPRYGAGARGEWPLDPDVTYLNHGGYGVAPSAVLAAQRGWRERIERNPTRFLAREQPQALREAAASVAAVLGAQGEDVVFVENATSGINAVLRSLMLEPGDEIVVPSLAYPAVLNAARFAAGRAGAHVREVALTLPVQNEDAVLDAVSAAFGPRTRLVLVDHIASAGALVLPVAALVARAHEAGATVLDRRRMRRGRWRSTFPRSAPTGMSEILHKFSVLRAARACGVLAGRTAGGAAGFFIRSRYRTGWEKVLPPSSTGPGRTISQRRSPLLRASRSIANWAAPTSGRAT